MIHFPDVPAHCHTGPLNYELRKNPANVERRNVNLDQEGSPFKITVTEHEDKVFVNCNTTVTHLAGTVERWLEKNKTLNLGKGILDPRGVYMCNGTEELAKEVSTVQVYYRSMCSGTHRDEIVGPAQVGTFWLKADCGEPICKGHSWWVCQNCVELDSATMAGVIIADLITTLLLALGVYCFAGHETGRLSRAADIQALLKNEQLYQPLRDREDAQYSRLGGNWPRDKRP
ncbi:T-cell surface glycoprotein CD3 delta chain [Apodemus speciosus]|uniref:T-cell surface glycoprotein CD3 delta chain n=1 Tax=Apodemus speciosus TaxID=105296 RepID=A0ABQ0F4D9_APOSI